MNLFFKGHKCRTIQMNVLDYKGLKSKTVKINTLEVSRTIKPLTMCMMHASQQRVFKVAENSFQHLIIIMFISNAQSNMLKRYDRMRITTLKS